MENSDIHINCDLGEGIQKESEIMPLIDACSIACGGHTGDYESIRRTMLLAAKHRIKVGAHPSYPDRVNFGRKPMNISNSELESAIKNQLELFESARINTGIPVDHIKFHGALYHDVAMNKSTCRICWSVVKQFYPGVEMYVPPNSICQEVNDDMDRPFKIVHEAFGDRRYNENGHLVSRTDSEAIFRDPQLVWDQILGVSQKQRIHTLNNTVIELKARTFCIHGDNPNALNILKFIDEKRDSWN